MNSFIDDFQIAALIIAVLVVTAKALYLRLVRKINPIVIGSGKKGFSLAVELIAVVGLLIWMIEVLMYSLHLSFRILPWPLDIELLNSLLAKVIGVVLITIGLVIFVLAYCSFGDSWRVGFDLKSPGVLITRGIFAATRNPIYLFLDLWFLGAFLINGALIFLIYAVAAIAVLHWQIRQEESFLLKLYAEPYRDYCDQTGRYLIW